MKTKLQNSALTLLFLALSFDNAPGQPSHTTIYTPKGHAVDVLVYGELMTPQQKIDSDKYWRNWSKSAVVLSSSTTTYNCHAWTWWVSESDTPLVWLLGPEAVWFYSDGSGYPSYVHVFPQVMNWGEKVTFTYDDHSATCSGPSGYFVSKWGKGPLMYHNWVDCPYYTGELVYYIRYNLLSIPQPNPPLHFSAVIIGSDVQLTWNGYTPGDNTNGFHVYKNYSKIFESNDPTITSWTDVGAVNSLSSIPIAYAMSYWNTNAPPENLSPVIPISAAPATVSEDTRWSGVVYVAQNSSVNSGTTLTILPGTTIQTNPGYYLAINGTISAVGNQSQRITFDRTGSSGSWYGLVLQSGSSGTISYCNLNHATVGVSCNSSAPTISYCTFLNNYFGIYCNPCTPSIQYNDIENSSNSGIYLTGASPNLIGNTIKNNSQYGVFCLNYSGPAMASNTISGSQLGGLYCDYHSCPTLYSIASSFMPSQQKDGGTVALKDPIPTGFAMESNYPNPFNPSTQIRYSLPEAGKVSLMIYDVLGREIANLANGSQPAGRYTLTWNSTQNSGIPVSSGVFFARLRVTDDLGMVKFTKTMRLLLMK